MIYYYINLDRRPDRRAHMEAALEGSGLTHERVGAVDGSHPEVRAEAAVLGPGRLNGCRISAGAYGCAQSHREAWRRLVASGASHAAVLEDDMHLAPGISKLAEAGWVPVDADVVKLETFGTRAHIGRRTRPAPGGRTLAALHSTHVGAGAYVLSAAMAARLLDVTEHLVDAVDEVLFNDRLEVLGRDTVLQMWPAPAVQDKRLGASGTGLRAAWGAGSIETRTAGGDVERSEGTAERTVRRLREEARALLQGTRYAVVPFG
jgi:glycosyl transferase family 25